MSYTMGEGNPNLGTIFDKGFPDLDYIPWKFVNAKHIMDPNQLKEDMDESAWSKFNPDELFWTEKAATNHTKDRYVITW